MWKVKKVSEKHFDKIRIHFIFKACLVILLPMVLADSRPVLRPERATTVPVKKDPFTGPPKPFAFRYGVADVDSGSNFDHAQKQDSSGVVTGQ